MNMNSTTKSQFVKQELRNICNARSEKQHMQQMTQHQHHSLTTSQSHSLQSPQQQPLPSPHSQQPLPSPHSQQQQPMTSPQLPPYPQQQQSISSDYESEIPLDILDQSKSIIVQYNLSKLNPFGTEEFVQFRQVFGLHRFKLHRHLVDGTVRSVWFRQVFGLLGVLFRQVSLYLI